MARLHRTAERVARVGRGSWQACDLVWDVLGDVLIGEPTCDPARPLGPQLEQEVRRRPSGGAGANGRGAGRLNPCSSPWRRLPPARS
jgi:hypothetical protein